MANLGELKSLTASREDALARAGYKTSEKPAPTTAPKDASSGGSSGGDDFLNMFKEMLQTVEKTYNADLRGSPFRDVIKPNDEASNRPSSQNTFPINSYYWYTSDLPKIFVFDYYNKISNVVQEYKAPTPTGKGLSGLLTSAVDSVIDNAKSYIDTVSNDIKNIATSLGILDKKSQKTVTTDFNKYLKSFPQIKVYEIKVNDNLTVMINLLIKGLSFLSSATSTGGMTDIAKTIVTNLVKNVKAFLKEVLGTDDFAQMYTPENRIKLAVILYRRLISGIYTGYYEIPNIGDDSRQYLVSNGDDGWKSSTLMGGLGENPIIKTLTDTLNNFVEGIDIASKPKWTASEQESYPAIRTKFVLFNDTYEHFEKNLKFVHCFVGGNLWVQDVLIQRSSSLYDIEVPGRLRLNLCAAKIDVKYLGKVRMNNKIFDENNKMLSMDDIISGKNNSPAIRPMDIKNTDLLRYIPDAFEVEIEFQSLIPNNFNTYMGYVYFNDGLHSVGDRLESVAEKIASNLFATEQNKSPTDEEIYNAEQASAIGEEGERL